MEQKLMKVCTGCGEEKEASMEYFTKDKKGKYGLSSKCKECNKKYYKNNKIKIDKRNKLWYEKNKEYAKTYNEKYLLKNKEKINIQHRQYRNANKETINEKVKKYREQNKDLIASYQKKYIGKNKKKLAEKLKEYQKNNKDKSNIRTQRYRAKKKLLPNTLTYKEWTKIKYIFNNECCYCGEEKQLEQEHFIPVVEGGEYTYNNIIPSCRNCNASKQNKDFFEWYPKQDFYSKEREEFILNHLGYKNNNQQLRII